MSRFKTPNREYGAGELKVLQRLNKYEFAVELWVMREGPNRNKWDYRNISEHYLSFRGAPILCAYVGREIGDGHNMRETRNPKTGESYYTFTDGTAERIVGTISDDEKDLSLAERDGHTWIVAKGRLWSFYAPELVDKIVRTGRMEVSAETEVEPGEKDEKGNEVYTNWTGVGVTILGDNVPPAIPGARIAALTAMQNEFKEMKLRVASLSSEQNKPNSTRKGVKQMSNKQAISRLASKFDGYRIVGLSEDGMRAALVDSAGRAYSYTFNQEDGEEIIQARIKPANLSAFYRFDGEDADVYVDIADITEYVAANARAKSESDDAKIADLSKQLSDATSELETMRKAEHARRIQSVKDILKATVASIRKAADDEDDDPADDADEIEKNAEDYACMEADGKFVGDQKAAHDLMARCMEKKLKRANNSRKKAYIWDSDNGEDGGSDSGIDELLSFFDNK